MQRQQSSGSLGMLAASALGALVALGGCRCNCPSEIAQPFDQEMPRTILATLEVYGSQSVETTGLLAIYDISTDTMGDKRAAAQDGGETVTYHYSALLRDARMTMLPEGNMMLDRGVLYVHAKKLVGTMVTGPEAAGGGGSIDGRDELWCSDRRPEAPLAMQIALLSVAAPSVVTTPTNAMMMITWVPLVIRPPIRAITIGTDFIVQAIEGSTPAKSIVRVFLVSKNSAIAIEPDPWNGTGDPPVVTLDSTNHYYEIVGQDFANGALLDMTEAQWRFVTDVRKDAERLGVE